jgi:hypothetical protein
VIVFLLLVTMLGKATVEVREIPTTVGTKTIAETGFTVVYEHHEPAIESVSRLLPHHYLGEKCS